MNYTFTTDDEDKPCQVVMVAQTPADYAVLADLVKAVQESIEEGKEAGPLLIEGEK